MKGLKSLYGVVAIKDDDTGTNIQFKATENNNSVFLKKGESASFKIKNGTGYIMSVDATIDDTGSVFNLNSSSLSELTPDNYYVELWIETSDDKVKIYPDTGFVDLKINENVLIVKGDVLPEITLSDFKKQIKEYLDSLDLSGGDSEQTVDLEEIRNLITSNTQGITENATAIAGNKALIETNAANITANNEAINTANDNIRTISSKIDSNSESVTTINDGVSDLKESVKNNSDDISKNRTDIDSNIAKIQSANQQLMAGQQMILMMQQQISHGTIQGNADLNTYTTPKVYEVWGANLTNSPVPSVWGILYCLAFNSGSNGMQLLIDTGGNRVYWRTWQAGSSFNQWNTL